MRGASPVLLKWIGWFLFLAVVALSVSLIVFHVRNHGNLYHSMLYSFERAPQLVFFVFLFSICSSCVLITMWIYRFVWQQRMKLEIEKTMDTRTRGEISILRKRVQILDAERDEAVRERRAAQIDLKKFKAIVDSSTEQLRTKILDLLYNERNE